MIKKSDPLPENPTSPPWDDNIKTLFFAFVLAMVLRSFLFEPFHIPSGSMKDTLLVGDYLFVSKYSYGYSHYSFPFGIINFKGRVMESIPKRGDVVVFRPPGRPNEDYIKRVIGLPGDRIQVKHSQLYINDVMVPCEDAGTYEDHDEDSITIARRCIETLPGGVVHNRLDRAEKAAAEGIFSQDNTDVYTVPAAHYFLMGDNRDNSTDSRFLNNAVGYVPAENLVGRAEFILFSVGDEAPFWHVWEWPFTMRWKRFFHSIH